MGAQEEYVTVYVSVSQGCPVPVVLSTDTTDTPSTQLVPFVQSIPLAGLVIVYVVGSQEEYVTVYVSVSQGKPVPVVLNTDTTDTQSVPLVQFVPLVPLVGLVIVYVVGLPDEYVTVYVSVSQGSPVQLVLNTDTTDTQFVQLVPLVPFIGLVIV